MSSARWQLQTKDASLAVCLKSLDPKVHEWPLGGELDIVVASVAFWELRTTERYLTALRAAIVENLGTFNADSVRGVLSKYLGSSLHVVKPDEF